MIVMEVRSIWVSVINSQLPGKVICILSAILVDTGWCAASTTSQGQFWICYASREQSHSVIAQLLQESS